MLLLLFAAHTRRKVHTTIESTEYTGQISIVSSLMSSSESPRVSCIMHMCHLQYLLDLLV